MVPTILGSGDRSTNDRTRLWTGSKSDNMQQKNGMKAITVECRATTSVDRVRMIGAVDDGVQ